MSTKLYRPAFSAAQTAQFKEAAARVLSSGTTGNVMRLSDAVPGGVTGQGRLAKITDAQTGDDEADKYKLAVAINKVKRSINPALRQWADNIIEEGEFFDADDDETPPAAAAAASSSDANEAEAEEAARAARAAPAAPPPDANDENANDDFVMVDGHEEKRGEPLKDKSLSEIAKELREARRRFQMTAPMSFGLLGVSSLVVTSAVLVIAQDSVAPTRRKGLIIAGLIIVVIGTIGIAIAGNNILYAKPTPVQPGRRRRL